MVVSPAQKNRKRDFFHGVAGSNGTKRVHSCGIQFLQRVIASKHECGMVQNAKFSR